MQSQSLEARQTLQGKRFKLLTILLLNREGLENINSWLTAFFIKAQLRYPMKLYDGAFNSGTIYKTS